MVFVGGKACLLSVDEGGVFQQNKNEVTSEVAFNHFLLTNTLFYRIVEIVLRLSYDKATQQKWVMETRTLPDRCS